jgi:hypothetical protein
MAWAEPELRPRRIAFRIRSPLTCARSSEEYSRASSRLLAHYFVDEIHLVAHVPEAGF